MGNDWSAGMVVKVLSRRMSRSRDRVKGRLGIKTICPDVNADVMESFCK